MAPRKVDLEQVVALRAAGEGVRLAFGALGLAGVVAAVAVLRERRRAAVSNA